LAFEADSLNLVRAQLWNLGMMALPAFALVLVVASWLRRITARPVGSAARAAIDSDEVASQPFHGEFPIAEVNRLMVELQETVAKLRESEHQLRLVTDNAPVGIMPSGSRSISA
jgi:hypothetical protein